MVQPLKRRAAGYHDGRSYLRAAEAAEEDERNRITNDDDTGDRKGDAYAAEGEYQSEADYLAVREVKVAEEEEWQGVDL